MRSIGARGSGTFAFCLIPFLASLVAIHYGETGIMQFYIRVVECIYFLEYFTKLLSRLYIYNDHNILPFPAYKYGL